MKYNPIGTTFKEGDITLKVEAIKWGCACDGCWYGGRHDNKRNYNAGCHIHGHACTPINRRDRKQVIFVEVREV